MTTTMQTDRRVRKTLAAQIDRLDGILDGLSEALSEAVLTAVKEAVGEAVRAAITEVLKNESLRAQPTPTIPVPQPERDSGRGPVRRALRGVGAWLGRVLRRGWNPVTAWSRRTWEQAKGLACRIAASGGPRVRSAWQQTVTGARHGRMAAWGVCLLARQFRKPLLLALGVGLATGLGCYLAGPLVASAVSGLCSLVLALLAQALRLLWQGLGAWRSAAAEMVLPAGAA